MAKGVIFAVFSFHFKAMNTLVEVAIECSNDDRSALQAHIEKSFEAAEHRFSRFLEGSELSRLNRQTGKRSIISEPMLQVLLLAEEYREQTKGLFSIFVHDAIQRVGYSRSFDMMSEEIAVDSIDLEGPLAYQIQIDPIMKSIQTPKGQRMDLGGIVKSWTVRQVSESLQRQWKLKRGLINAGGDLIVWGGSAEGEPWIVGIADPWQAESEDEIVVMLAEGAAATSSILRRRWSTNQGVMHHLIDPRSLSSSTSDIVQCSIAGSDPVACEIWAKVLCIAGVEEGISLLRRKTRQLEALFFTKHGEIHFYGTSRSLSARWNDLTVHHIHEPID
jgi:thiamine biosynthesis lipoprotein